MSLSFEQLETIQCMEDPQYWLDNYGFCFNANTQKLEQIKCYDYQRQAIANFEAYQNSIVLKSRQCLPAGTFVDTPSGPRPIESFKVGDKVFSYNLKTNKVEIDTVYDAWESGERQCVKFKLKDSRSFEVGENHPFWVKNKQSWIKAKDLERGDEILDADLGFGNISVKPEEIKLLAYLITDGCTNKQIKFTNNNINYLEEFEQSSLYCFPELEIRKTPKLKGFDYFPHQKHGISTKNPIMSWCEEKGIANKKTEFKNLPEEVFNWDKNSVSLLINRMFAGDGWISILKKGVDNKRLELGIASPSKMFLEQVRNLLKKFSIKSNIYEVKNMKLQKNVFYKLRITHSKSISIFVKEIGIFCKVKKEHLDIINNCKHDVKSSSTIQKVEFTEKKICYDISVDKNENFLINGLLTHNTGFSVISAAYIAWTVMFKSDQRVLILANDLASAVRLLKTVKDFINNTPNFLLPGEIIKNNEKNIEFPNGSWVKAVACSPQAGRGESLTLLVVDEAAFIENDDDIKAGAMMAVSRTGGKTIMISTPNGTSNMYYQNWVASIKQENNYKGLIAHWTQNPDCNKDLEKRLDADTGREYWWNEWYQQQCERLGFDRVKIAQELDLSFESSKYLAIDANIVGKYRDDVKNNDPICFFDHSNFYSGINCFVKDRTPFWIWEMPDPNKKYIVTSDVARGDGKDYSTIQVLDAINLVQVAEYQSKITSDKLAEVIFAIAKIYNEAFVAIEVNNMGLTTAYYLHKNMGYKDVYKSKSIQEVWTGPRDSRWKVEEGDEIPGFQTSHKTRPFLIDSLRKYMREKTVKINSPRLITEFDTFVIKENGRAEHEKGANDDLIFAFAIALFIRDVEWEKITKGRKMYEAMLDAFSTSRTPISGKVLSPEEQKALKKKGENNLKSPPPIFIFRNESDEANREDDNLDWLFD